MQAELLVPAKTLLQAAQAGSDGSAVWLQLGEKTGIGKTGIVAISNETKHSTSRLLDAEYPEYAKIVPDEYTAVATVTVADTSHRSCETLCTGVGPGIASPSRVR